MNTIRNEVPNEVTSTFNTAGPPGGIPRMRTVQKIVEEIRKMDPNTEMSLHCIRAIIATEQIPVVHVGRKKLVDLDLMLEYLANGGTVASSPKKDVGVIRPVQE